MPKIDVRIEAAFAMVMTRLGVTANLSFSFHGDLFTFDANVGSTVLAAQTLALLHDHVVLTDRARLLLTKPRRLNEDRLTEISSQRWEIW